MCLSGLALFYFLFICLAPIQAGTVFILVILHTVSACTHIDILNGLIAFFRLFFLRIRLSPTGKRAD